MLKAREEALSHHPGRDGEGLPPEAMSKDPGQDKEEVAGKLCRNLNFDRGVDNSDWVLELLASDGPCRLL
jgi:hypothetical protein